MSELKQSIEEFVIARTFNAPRDMVWAVCTEPKHIQHWSGPKGSTVVAAKMDFRPGGGLHIGLRSPDGHEMWDKCVYHEIVPPERLVFVNSFSNERGELIRHPLSATWPIEMLSTYTFAEHNGLTTFTIAWLPYNAPDDECRAFDESREGMTQGWTGSLNQLEAYLTTL